jgi:hypothetical protein
MQSPLGQILMDAQVITLETLEEALLRATQERRRLGEELIAMGAASTTDVLRGPWRRSKACRSFRPKSCLRRRPR